MTRVLDIDDFLPAVLEHAPNTSDLVAFQYLIEAARTLCERVDVWRERETFEAFGPEDALLTIQDADIHRIDAAMLNGQKLEPKTVQWLDANEPGWDLNDEINGTASYITQTSRNTVRLVPASQGTFTGRLILKPARKALTLPEILLTEYRQEVGRGAAGLLLARPAEDANPQLAGYHQQWFNDRLDTLHLDAVRGQQNARMRTTGAYF
jgi:hypothetical protein